jgi:hypothetical protein
MKIKFVGASGGQEQICMKEREGAGAEGYKGATGASKVIANASSALSKFSRILRRPSRAASPPTAYLLAVHESIPSAANRKAAS